LKHARRPDPLARAETPEPLSLRPTRNAYSRFWDWRFELGDLDLREEAEVLPLC